MRIVMFCHSLLSDWNHGNAHFLRGVASDLIERGHDVRVYEPRNAWSLVNLVQEHGKKAIAAFRQAYPTLHSTRYVQGELDIDEALSGADVVLVHEWNDHDLVSQIGKHRASSRSYRLYFHDTHHRAVTDRDSMAGYDLRHYDGVLAFGSRIRDLYLKHGWARRAWTWHEAADTRVFYPRGGDKNIDLIWIGNWGDEERTAELHEFLLQPVKELGLKARVHGVRYPDRAKKALADHGIEFAGWLPNFAVPDAFATAKLTVHVPRRPYVESLPGIPTIRPFEALACGIPLVSSRWDDAEGLFSIGEDLLMVETGRQMTETLARLLTDDRQREALSENGLRTIHERHTCSHRVDELLSIDADVQTSLKGRVMFA
jgi:spore maturation protein CgeB